MLAWSLLGQILLISFTSGAKQLTLNERGVGGVAVERRIRDREVVGSSLGRALRRKNSGQVSHTYG